VGAFNAGGETLSIPIGDRFCQVVLETLQSAPTKDYGAKGGRYQDQRGITLAK
jgi:dCTP deaminase